jgi:hypothetical protein
MARNGVKLPSWSRLALFVGGGYEFGHRLMILRQQDLVSRLNLLEQFGELSGFDFLSYDHALNNTLSLLECEPHMAVGFPCLRIHPAPVDVEALGDVGADGAEDAFGFQGLATLDDAGE